MFMEPPASFGATGPARSAESYDVGHRPAAIYTSRCRPQGRGLRRAHRGGRPARLGSRDAPFALREAGLLEALRGRGRRAW